MEIIASTLLTVVLLSVLTEIDTKPIITRKSLAEKKDHEKFCSNLLNFNNFYYALQEQINVTGIPADMSIHWKTGKVFFTLISDEMKMTLQIMQRSGEFETIKVAGLGQSTTVDNLNDIIYLATDNGVYKYKEDGTTELYTALREDVMYLAVTSDGGTMYVATWPQNRVQKITKDGKKQELFPLIPNGHGLTIDTRNNIYFVVTKTTYILKSGEKVPIKIHGLPNDKITGVFVSRSDDVFAMDEGSNLYYIDPDTTKATHLGYFKIHGVNSFAMDSADNVLIGVKGAIYKFNAYEKNPCKSSVETGIIRLTDQGKTTPATETIRDETTETASLETSTTDRSPTDSTTEDTTEPASLETSPTVTSSTVTSTSITTATVSSSTVTSPTVTSPTVTPTESSTEESTETSPSSTYETSCDETSDASTTTKSSTRSPKTIKKAKPKAPVRTDKKKKKKPTTTTTESTTAEEEEEE